MVKKIVIPLLLVGVGAAAFWLLKNKDVKATEVQMEMATEITSIKEVAEWEFLTLDVEEIEDTLIPRVIIKDDQFVRIFKGKARLGVDMKSADSNWIACSGDTARILLPQIRILDENIIDDMQTRTFYESGKMPPAIKEALYQKAKRDMRKRALSVENVKAAKENAKAQFTYLFHSMGYNNVSVSFVDETGGDWATVRSENIR